MIRRKTGERGEALLDDDEFADLAEDVGVSIEDLVNNYNAMETIVTSIH